ncbi:TetR/AcrR family transcriptional regulator [Pseudonocardia sp. TRM90224]|uniref:TetR/AcrR family transcriptional regulator n=1 Tax=Pseudonocardia sp. TRM90224 TaxID=2812678 RepID=UPI001E2D7C03|nr:TetR/AcrR family transcriptional regulator [Pseudonocardia sp. TRM90224]
MNTESSGVENVRRSLGLLWGIQDEPTRGPKPGLGVEQIVRAATTVADTEGLGALSMRRIATELGAGAMSLYRYVPGKAELVDLMMDAAYAEVLAEADTQTGDWRTRLDAFARREWAMYMRHPWMLQIAQGRPLLAPSPMRSTDIALRAVHGLGLDADEMLGVIVLVSSFVAGLARTTIDAKQAAERTGVTDEEWWSVQNEFVGPVVAAGKLPLVNEVGEAGAFASDFDELSFGLACVLDGLAVLISRRSVDNDAATGSRAAEQL